MTSETDILTTLELYFNVERISSSKDIGVDAILSIKNNSNVRAYIIVNKSVRNNKQDDIIRSITQDQLAKLPIIIFEQNANNVTFGLLSYWDFDSYFINKNINWREYNVENINWLITQISIRRGSIKLLDSDMCRVVKTIYLNYDDMIDGEIKYLRSFSETYKMKDTSMISEEERIKRLIHGTPEEDYPKDELDEVLYQQVLKTYPKARIKSSLLLFDSELLDLRLLKERKLQLFHLYFIPIIYNETGLPINNSMLNYEIMLELYYTPNFFRETNILPINQVVQMFVNSDNFIQKIKDTYQPLSIVNI